MMTLGPPEHRPQFTIGRIMIGIAALAVVLWLAIYLTWLFILMLFVGVNAYTFLLTRSPRRPEPPRRPPAATDGAAELFGTE